MPATMPTSTTGPSQGTEADTWGATNEWADHAGAQYRNETTPADYYDDDASSISLTSIKSKREMRKIDGGKKRAATFLGDFDKKFNSRTEKRKPSKSMTA